MGKLLSRYGIHPYYTLNFTKIQAKLAKTRFFVNYDDFYVNIVMLTAATTRTIPFIIFDYNVNILGTCRHPNTKYRLCKFSFTVHLVGKFRLLPMQSAQFLLWNFVSPPGFPATPPPCCQNRTAGSQGHQHQCNAHARKVSPKEQRIHQQQ